MLQFKNHGSGSKIVCGFLFFFFCVFLRRGVPKIWSKVTGEHPCRSEISLKLPSNLIEITFRHGCSPVNLQHIIRTPFLRFPLDGCFCFSLIKNMNFDKNEKESKIGNPFLERQTFSFSSDENRKLKVKLWWVGAH